MIFKVIKDREECAQLWKKLSTPECWWDEWEVRECFLTEGHNKLYFLVGYENEEVVGVLPLCFNEEKDRYESLGGGFPEYEKFLLKDKTKIGLFFDQGPGKIWIDCIDKREKDFFPLKKSYSNYYLDLVKIQTLENYLLTFSKKHRRNLLADIKKISADGYKIQTSDTDSTLLEALEKYNKERFGEDSSFCEKGFKESLENIIRLTKKEGILQMISIRKETQIVAALIAVLYKGTYICILSGSDPKISNLGKLLIYTYIENAFHLKAKKIDFLGGQSTWKKLWNLETEELYEFTKNVFFPSDPNLE